MPADTLRVPSDGKSFLASRYYDSVQLIRDRNTDNSGTIATPPAFITVAAYNALLPTSGRIAQISTGTVRMGPTDELLVFFGGVANNATANYAVWAYFPVISATDDGRQTLTGYMQHIVGFGAITLGALTVAAQGALTLAGGTGIVATDVLGDTIVPTATFSNHQALVDSNQSDGMASVKIVVPGAVALAVKTQLTTATQLFAFGLRRQGNAQRTN